MVPIFLSLYLPFSLSLYLLPLSLFLLLPLSLHLSVSVSRSVTLSLSLSLSSLSQHVYMLTCIRLCQTVSGCCIPLSLTLYIYLYTCMCFLSVAVYLTCSLSPLLSLFHSLPPPSPSFSEPLKADQTVYTILSLINTHFRQEQPIDRSEIQGLNFTRWGGTMQRID